MEKSAQTGVIYKKDYPALLKEIYNPPSKLFFKGDPKLIQKTCISIVGTRKNTDYGEFMTKKIVSELSHLDIAIVSGLAKGIDTIAHKSALEHNLPTIAVLGNGIDYIYPKQNTALARNIKEKGLILSEYEGSTEPRDFHFPQRNRIVSGLSLITMVIEAPEKSGALITARFALEQGRDIAVVPGDADREASKGVLNLLQRGGAYPIASGRDIIEMLQKQPSLFRELENHGSGPHAGSSAIPRASGRHTKSQSLPTSAYNLSRIEKQILENLSLNRTKTLEEIRKKIAQNTAQSREQNPTQSPAQSREQNSASPPIQNLLAAISMLEIYGLIEIKYGKYKRTC